MRESMERNGSAQNGSTIPCKREVCPYLCGTVPNRTIPKSACKRSLKLNCFYFTTLLSIHILKKRK